MAEKILIVDDDLDTLRLIGVMLQRHGYEIVAATNGAQAITMATNERPDLIILDVMMPGMDGLEVTDKIRKDPFLANTPILMFTAKSQVDDKVAGYESGADDYLTKPVHPAELSAHIKSLLSRTRIQIEAEDIPKSGFVIGVIGSKGGLGISTLTLNLAASLARQSATEVVAAEMRPGQGTWSTELEITSLDALDQVLSFSDAEINSKKINETLISTSFGVKLLLASHTPKLVDFPQLKTRTTSIISTLTRISPITVLDIGTTFSPAFETICGQCHLLLAVTDSTPLTVSRTKEMIHYVNSGLLHLGCKLDLVVYNRSRSDTQLTAVQVTDLLGGIPIKLMVPPVPELAYQAYQKQLPLVMIQPDGLAAQQINDYAKAILSQIHT